MHELWDPHAGLKPLPLDNYTLDANIKMEDNLLYSADIKLSGTMVDMMIDLDDGNVQDSDWLPLREQHKLDARKTGLINFALRWKYYDNLLVCREKENPLSWA
jgi:hypothetical protein